MARPSPTLESASAVHWTTSADAIKSRSASHSHARHRALLNHTGPSPTDSNETHGSLAIGFGEDGDAVTAAVAAFLDAREY